MLSRFDAVRKLIIGSIKAIAARQGIELTIESSFDYEPDANLTHLGDLQNVKV